MKYIIGQKTVFEYAEISSCPFCGSDTMKVYESEDSYSNSVTIKCDNNECGAKITAKSYNEGINRTKERAIKMWNRRAHKEK